MPIKQGKNEDYSIYNKELSRINRMIGQLEGIKKMIKDERSFVDIITQLKAVGSATKSLEIKLLEWHLEDLLDDMINSKNPRKQKQRVTETLNILKQFA